MEDLFSLILQHPDVVKQPDRRGEALAWCPWHNDKDGKNPNLGINVSKKVVKCFSCGKGGIKNLARAWGIQDHDEKQDRKAPAPYMSAEAAIQALEDAYGITAATITHFKIESAPTYPSPNNSTRGAWKYPTHCGMRYKAFDRKAKPKYWWARGTDADKRNQQLYGASDIPAGTSTVYLVNGEPSVWVCWQAGVHAVAAFGEGNVPDEAVAQLAERGVKRVLLIPDLDNTGASTAFRTLKKFRGAGVSAQAVKLPDYLGDKADAADLYIWCKRQSEAFQQALSALPVWEPPNPDPLDETKFFTREGRIWQVQSTKEGDVDVPLTNFVAYATEETIVDDGVETIRAATMVGELDNGTRLTPERIPLTELNSLNWIPRVWGIYPVIKAGQSSKEAVREVIQRLSIGMGAPRRTVYTHTGWRKVNERWQYLMPEPGNANNDGSEVELPEAYSRYALPSHSQETVSAVKASLRFLFVAERIVTIPILTYVYLAPLTPFLSPSFALWLRARTGSFKSTITALALSHFGQFDYNSPPASWDSTARGLERYLFDLKDCICWVDDFAPKITQQEVKELQQKAEHVLRAFGNRSSRMRMTRNITTQRSFPPRGLLMSTAELYPSGESVLARFFPVDFQREDVDLSELSFAQEEADLYPHAMKAFIKWVGARYEDFAVSLPEQYRELRKETWLNAGHPRIRDAMATMMVGVNVLCDFALEVGATTKDRIADIKLEAQAVFAQIGKQHVTRVSDQDPVHRFLSVLDTLQSQNHIAFMRKGSDAEPPAGKDLMGWYDTECVYIDPVAAYNRVSKWLRDEGRSIGLTEESLRQALKEAGLVAKADDGRTTALVRVNGRRHRVMALHRERIAFAEHFPAEVEQHGF